MRGGRLDPPRARAQKRSPARVAWHGEDRGLVDKSPLNGEWSAAVFRRLTQRVFGKTHGPAPASYNHVPNADVNDCTILQCN